MPELLDALRSLSNDPGKSIKEARESANSWPKQPINMIPCALIPLTAWGFSFLAFHKRGYGLRESFLSASVAWGFLLVIMTEGLSLFEALTFTWVAGLWGMATLAAAAAYFFLKPVSNTNTSPKKIGLSPIITLLICGICVIAAGDALNAVIAPPNNWDAMVYHLPRVMHWIQNKSVMFYPTGSPIQNCLTPGGEYIFLHLQLLTGGDYLINLVQWFSMIGSILGITLITRELNGDKWAQLCSAVIAATIPMGVLQGCNPKDDWVVSFWLVCFVYFFFVLKNHCKLHFNWRTLGLLGASLGLAFSAKATAYFFAPPFCSWLFFSKGKDNGIRLAKAAAVISLFALFLNLGYYWRNFKLYQNPFGSGCAAPCSIGFRYTNEKFTLGSFVSNVLRQSAIHMTIPGIDGPKLGAFYNFIVMAIKRIDNSLGEDLNDPATTMTGSNFQLGSPSVHEDFVTAPAQLFLLFLSLALLVFSKKLTPLRDLYFYSLSVIFSFFLFCAVLKWFPFASRLHLPYFVLWSPVIGMAMAKTMPRSVVAGILTLLLLSGATLMLFNGGRPMVGKNNIFYTPRLAQYFVNFPAIEKPYTRAASLVRSMGCERVGLILDWDDWEYPFWLLLGNKQTVRIEDIEIQNRSRKLLSIPPFNRFVPCAIISMGFGRAQANMITFKGIPYHIIWASEPIPWLGKREIHLLYPLQKSSQMIR